MAYRIELFCEDNAHEACARAMIDRIAHEADREVTIHVASGRFGLPRMKRELRAFQEALRKSSGTPDLLVVVADGNDDGTATRRREVNEVVDSTVFPHWIVGAPDPYVERWLLADPVSFAQCFGQQPVLGEPRTRGGWKQRLVESLEAAGEIVTQGGAEFAAEIVEAMDFYRAGREAPSLKQFADELRHALMPHS